MSVAGPSRLPAPSNRVPTMLKLDRLLSDADRAAFDELIARPGTRIQDAHAWVRDRGYAVSTNAVYSYVRRQRPDRSKNLRPSKLDKISNADDRAAIDALCSDPSRTPGDLHQLVTSKGYSVSKISCARHMRNWRLELEDIRRSARFARSLCRVAQEVGPSAFSGGAALGFEQVVLEQVFRLRDRDEVGPRDLNEWAAALERAITVREQVEALRRRSGRTKDKPDPGKPGTDAASDKRPQVVNGVEIANCVRQILGIPPMKTPAPAGLPAPSQASAPLLPLPPGEGGGEGA